MRFFKKIQWRGGGFSDLRKDGLLIGSKQLEDCSSVNLPSALQKPLFHFSGSLGCFTLTPHFSSFTLIPVYFVLFLLNFFFSLKSWKVLQRVVWFSCRFVVRRSDWNNIVLADYLFIGRLSSISKVIESRDN